MDVAFFQDSFWVFCLIFFFFPVNLISGRTLKPNRQSQLQLYFLPAPPATGWKPDAKLTQQMCWEKGRTGWRDNTGAQEWWLSVFISWLSATRSPVRHLKCSLGAEELGSTLMGLVKVLVLGTEWWRWVSHCKHPAIFHFWPVGENWPPGTTHYLKSCWKWSLSSVLFTA